MGDVLAGTFRIVQRVQSTAYFQKIGCGKNFWGSPKPGPRLCDHTVLLRPDGHSGNRHYEPMAAIATDYISDWLAHCRLTIQNSKRRNGLTRLNELQVSLPIGSRRTPPQHPPK